MNSLWNDTQVKKLKNSPLAMRVYTSQLLGQNADLVLHGGGNTSVKDIVKDLFGADQEVLYVKGSGWDLATIKSEGFAPVKMDMLLKMAKLENLTDTEMVRWQRSAMLDPYAPNPSVEAILHAIIPFKFVDHTHADAVVTVTNTPGGKDRIKEIYGNRVIVIPYVMPGFVLAKKVYEMTKNIDWSKYEGIILLNHGVFTFDNDARKSYEKMIKLVSEAENYLVKNKAAVKTSGALGKVDYLKLAQIRKEVSALRGQAMIASVNTDSQSVDYSNLSNLKKCATQGPLTPDHVIRTKRIPMIISSNIQSDVKTYKQEYHKYFDKYKMDGLKCLDAAPRWAVWPKCGTISFGRNIKEANIVADIVDHTIKAISSAEKLGGWKALPAKDIFDVEYWELEQAKLAKQGSFKTFEGKVAVVTGAASGIGKATVERLHSQGASVAAVDINSDVQKTFNAQGILGIKCDLTNENQIIDAIEKTVMKFGGIDILVSNAGSFPASKTIQSMDQKLWQKSLDVNLSTHQMLIKHITPFLELGIDPAIVIVASKNVPAPGKGAAAYSVAKAGLTQLARIAALELAEKKIRVNITHPNAVFDTAIWTKEILKKRAEHYNMSVDAYKRNNLLQTEITSYDVADLICMMAGPVFAKTTGSQIPIDGGSERII